eukprot:CAMPEP_0202856918 /NCGR_PEP_ID=MMETSP1391-20130828/38_1 /ASSEMBLY_ACC=CAM_ASM_000867 /TAXON_ID=1034604 /ORGANISM="Chlamydomonas leiostraca, Strain SAG 11-49" /LENGTH=276 /DNA_ID=CAMNT_0049535635 /DNA_START=65 /DNA_END=895 /DNA_ORIENTATION=+
MICSKALAQPTLLGARGAAVKPRPVLPLLSSRAGCQALRQVAARSSSSLYPEVPSADGSFAVPQDLVQSYDPVAEEQAMLREASGATKSLSFVGFWVQFALSVVSAGILVFSVAFVPKTPGSGIDVSKYLTLVGVLAAFASSLFAHGFLTLSRKLQSGGTVAKAYLVGTLLTNNAICLAGIGITVIGLQASVGTLVAKTLATAVSGPFTVQQGGNALVSLDVFALQASTNTLLCHVIGLLFTNLMLRLVNRAPKPGSAAAAAAAAAESAAAAPIAG